MSKKAITIPNQTPANSVSQLKGATLETFIKYLRQTGTGFMIIGHDHHLRYINEAAMDILRNGIKMELDPMKNFTEQVSIERRAYIREYINSGLQGNLVSYEIEYPMIEAGESRWLSIKGVPVKKNDGSTEAVAVEIHDISLQKEMESRLEEMRLSHKKEVVRSVIQNMEIDRREIANVLHENINQVLAAAKLFIETERDEHGNLTACKQGAVDILSETILEINKICNNINPDSLKHVGIVDLLHDIAEILGKDKRVSIRLDTTGHIASLHCDKEHELTLLRVAQETTNRLCHFDFVKEIGINFRHVDQKMFLDIMCDRGKIDLDLLAGELVMRNLTNRCEQYGGAFTLTTDADCLIMSAWLPNWE